MTHDLTSSLIARRSIVGPYSPEGRRDSVLIEQLDIEPVDEAHAARLRKAMARTVSEVAQIQADGGRFVHASHGAPR